MVASLVEVRASRAVARNYLVSIGAAARIYLAAAVILIHCRNEDRGFWRGLFLVYGGGVSDAERR